MARSIASARELIVRPRTGRAESLAIALLCGLIAGLMALRFAAVGEDAVAPALRPYQRLDAQLDNGQRTLYRTLLASVPEIIALRDLEGLWPETGLLRADGIPPFDGRFLPSTLQGYSWFGHDGGAWVDYLGRDPSGTHGTSFILRLIDLHAGYHPHPHPGIDYDPDRIVAAQVWLFPDGGVTYPGERLPEAGWVWLVQAGDPVLTRPPTTQPDGLQTTAAPGSAPAGGPL